MGGRKLKLLLDTHALIWWLGGREVLPVSVRDAIGDPGNIVLVSAVSALEVTIKFRLGKLPSMAELAQDFEGVLERHGFGQYPITIPHAALAGSLQSIHRDPFDRTLIAQALIDDLVLVSNEALFDSFGVSRLW